VIKIELRDPKRNVQADETYDNQIGKYNKLGNYL